MRPHGEPGEPGRPPGRPGPVGGPAPGGAHRVPARPQAGQVGPAAPPGRHGHGPPPPGGGARTGRPAPVVPPVGGPPPGRDPGASPANGSSVPRDGAPGPTSAPAAASSGSAESGTDAPSDGDGSPDTLLAGAGGYASRPPRPRDAPPTSGPTRSVGADADDGGDGGGSGGRHRRGGAGSGPGRDEGGRHGGAAGTGRKGRKKGSFWRELPLLIVVAVVLTFVIQTFLGRIYVIPSASMERTLHGCTGCANDRVAVDKLTYRFSDPAPGDVVVFRGPPAWAENDEVSGERSGNVVVRGLQDAGSLIGLAPPDEKDFVKRVIATGGQQVQCCDPQNRVLVDGRPLTEPYLFFQDGFGSAQEPFDPVTVPDGQLWVMGDNRNNSADARVHGPIGITDVIGKARAIVLPVGRWGGVPDTDPQAAPAALGLGAAAGLPAGLPAAPPVPVPAPATAAGGRPGS